MVNNIIQIIHNTSDKWSGSPTTNEGDKYLITWKLPQLDDQDNEKNEQRLEQRTEYADKALITAVKIISEIRRMWKYHESEKTLWCT